MDTCFHLFKWSHLEQSGSLTLRVTVQLKSVPQALASLGFQDYRTFLEQELKSRKRTTQPAGHCITENNAFPNHWDSTSQDLPEHYEKVD